MPQPAPVAPHPRSGEHPSRGASDASAGPAGAAAAGSSDPIAVWGGRAIVAAMVIIALWSAHDLTRPFFIDQGAFAWVGDTILRGGMPYRDAWDIKGPVTYYIAAVAQLLFGRNEWGFRLYDLLWMYAGAAGVALVVRRLQPGRAAPLWAAALFLLWYGALSHRNSAQPDGWATVVIVVSAYAALRGATARSGWAWTLLSGACVGVCVLFKPTYAAFLAGPAVYLLVRHWRAGWTRWFVPWLVLGAGVAAPVALCVAWFSARGGLDEMVNVYLRYNATFYAGLDLGWAWRLQSLGEWMLLRQFAIPMPLAVVGGALLVRRRPAEGALIVAWAVAVLVNTAAQGKFWPYHWIPLYAPLAVLTGVGIGALYEAVRAHRGSRDGEAVRLSFVALVGVVWGSAALTPAYTVYRWGKTLGRPAATDAYEAREYDRDGRQRESFRTIGRYVQERTGPADVVLFWGQHPGHQYLLNRPGPGRFGYTQPLLEGKGTPLVTGYRREFVQDLRTRPPKYVVVLGDSVLCRGVKAPYEMCAEALPELDRYLDDNYRVEAVMPAVAESTTVRLFNVLRRNGG